MVQSELLQASRHRVRQTYDWDMIPTLAKAVVDLLLMGIVGTVAARRFFRTHATPSLLELVGAFGWAMLGVTHICEGLHVFPAMHWGIEGSPGHYLNLASLAVGLLLPVGYILQSG